MGLGSIVTAIWQSEESKKIKEQNGERPQYEIPDEYKNILTDAQLQASEGLPAAQKQQYIENVVRGQQGAIQGIASRKGGLQGLGALEQRGQDAYKQLLAGDVAARQNNRGQLNNARQLYGQGQEKQFLLNKLYPWQQNDALRQSYSDAAFENFNTGITDIKNTVLGAVSGGGGNTGQVNTSSPSGMSGGANSIGGAIGGGNNQGQQGDYDFGNFDYNWG